MSRREKLISIGQCFQDEAKLKETANKDVMVDLALLAYAMKTDNLHKLSKVLDVGELSYDINHTEKHFRLITEREKFKEV